MKTNYINTTSSIIFFYLFVIVFASSCTIYQNVPGNDGIYSSNTTERNIIVANSDEHRDFEQNYFTKELERIDNINGTDILTDIETYSSVNDTISNSRDSISNYNTNSAWGYEDSQSVVININLNNNNGFGWGNNWNLYDPYIGYGYGSFNSWYGRPWGLRWGNRWNNGYYWGGYGYFNNPYNNPWSLLSI